jgi:hypothetical protein
MALARRARDPKEWLGWLNMAQMWLRLAQSAEQRGSDDIDTSVPPEETDQTKPSP